MTRRLPAAPEPKGTCRTSENRTDVAIDPPSGFPPEPPLTDAGAFSDETFRKGFRSAARKREKQFGKTGFSTFLPDGRTKVVPGEYTVVYGVMRHRYVATGALGLPFFSKVALRAAAERKALMGFPVELHLIEKL